MNAKRCLTLAAVCGFLGVFLGAFGAHGLKDSGYLEKKYAAMEPKNYAGEQLAASHKYLLDFETGIRYHMWHALALAATGILMLNQPGRLLNIAAWCFAGGILLFCGALYVLVIGGPVFGGVPWGAVAPFGGTLLLAGWVFLALASCRLKIVHAATGATK